MPSQTVELLHSVELLAFNAKGELYASLVVRAGANALLPGGRPHSVLCDPDKGYVLQGRSLGPMSKGAKTHDGGMRAAICVDLCALFEAGKFPLVGG